MRLPRRVPWASVAELDQVCSWIYADEHDLDAKSLAVNRISAWRAITYLPHALESTLAILVVILQDNAASAGSSTYLSLRQSYASAIIRLVNGLVDPLQLGTYARSIASIAAQLGLPAWLVELRHAATHEDLPSLELLRDAAKESMNWLLHNYFLPTINPVSAARPEANALRPVGPLLKQYKSLLKIVARDASLKTRYKAEISVAMRDIERWVAEAKVTANAFGWDVEGTADTLDGGEQDPKERWALDQLCTALLEPGGLVPLSKKKRTLPADAFAPPALALTVWAPLLRHLEVSHPDLPSVLAQRLVAHITNSEAARDPSFDACAARWALWLAEEWDSEGADAEFSLKRELLGALISACGPGRGTLKSHKAARLLLQALCSGCPELQAVANTLLPLTDSAPSHQWQPGDIDMMEERLQALLAIDAQHEKPSESPALAPLPLAELESEVPGWRLLDASNWKPCPIGVYWSVL